MGSAATTLVGAAQPGPARRPPRGVAILKREGMRRELDPGSLALQATVRHTLDPREAFRTATCPRNSHALDDGQSVFTAASSFCAAVFTWPRAATTPETVLVPGLAARLPAAVLSESSAALSALVWACH